MDTVENNAVSEREPVTEGAIAPPEEPIEAAVPAPEVEAGDEDEPLPEAAVSAPTAEEDEPLPEAEASAPTGDAESPQEAEEGPDAEVVARDTLDQILQAMGVPATVTGERQPDNSVRLLVEGSDMGVVIGKHGGTINALQYLIGLIVQKRSGERIRLVIDAEGYRSRREQALRDLAINYAQRVKESGQEAVLDALQAYERRIIHNTLSDDPDVFTYSEGEEPDRRVVISPREAEGAEA
jgi:spoIIIJ-associated protein